MILLLNYEKNKIYVLNLLLMYVPVIFLLLKKKKKKKKGREKKANIKLKNKELVSLI